MKIEALLDGTEYEYLYTRCREDITSATHSPEKILNGCAYFYLRSGDEDEEYIKRIIEHRPAVIIGESGSAFSKYKIPFIAVHNPRLAYSIAASRLAGIEYDKLKIIGITGTNGKTSTAVMIRHILEYCGYKTGFIGTGRISSADRVISESYYSMTSPDADILYPALKYMQSDGCSHVVMEVSSHALALEKVAPIPFEIAVFTGLSHEHLDFHKDMESYFKAKSRLIETAKRAIINYDDGYGKRLYETYGEKCDAAGIIWQKDIWATDILRRGLDGFEYIYKSDTLSTRIKLALAGDYNVYNSIFAIGAALHLGIKPVSCKEALSGLGAIKGRLELVSKYPTVIIDYAHTPLALEIMLKNVNSNKNAGQNIILVFGCGGDRDKSKRPVMASIAEKYAKTVIVTTDNSRTENPQNIIFDILRGFKKGDYAVINDRAAAIRYAIKIATDDDIVIISGKGHEEYILDAGGYHAFDERAVIKRAIDDRRRGENEN